METISSHFKNFFTQKTHTKQNQKTSAQLFKETSQPLILILPQVTAGLFVLPIMLIGCDYESASKPLPGKPKHLTAIQISSQEIELTWDASKNADGYNIYMSNAFNDNYKSETSGKAGGL